MVHLDFIQTNVNTFYHWFANKINRSVYVCLSNFSGIKPVWSTARKKRVLFTFCFYKRFKLVGVWSILFYNVMLFSRFASRMDQSLALVRRQTISVFLMACSQPTKASTSKRVDTFIMVGALVECILTSYRTFTAWYRRGYCHVWNQRRTQHLETIGGNVQ